MGQIAIAHGGLSVAGAGVGGAYLSLPRGAAEVEPWRTGVALHSALRGICVSLAATVLSSDRRPENPMTLSMYQASVPVFIRMLDNLAAILEKAAAPRRGEEDRPRSASRKPPVSRHVPRW